MTHSIDDEISDENFIAFFAQTTSDDETVAESCGVDPHWGYFADSFEQNVAQIIGAVFGGGPEDLGALVSPPSTQSYYQFDLIVGGDSLIEGGRYALNPGPGALPVLASNYLDARHFMDRELVGIPAAIDVACSAQDYYRELTAHYRRLTAQAGTP